MKTLANFSSTGMAGQDPAIQSQLKRPVFFWMAASKGGHDDGIGGTIRVIKFRDDDFKDMSANPVLIEVTRGAAVESRHRGAFVVVDASGKIVHSAGDPHMPIYPRSAVKPLQAIPLIETGAADRFGLTTRSWRLPAHRIKASRRMSKPSRTGSRASASVPRRSNAASRRRARPTPQKGRSSRALRSTPPPTTAPANTQDFLRPAWPAATTRPAISSPITRRKGG